MKINRRFLSQLRFNLWQIVALLAASVTLPASVQGFQTESESTPSPSGQQDQIELPQGQETPIFVFDMAGGFRRGPKLEPTFRLFADGTLVAVNNRQKQEFRMAPDELQRFLQIVIQENQLYQHKSAAIEAQMAAQGKLPKNQIADAPSSTFILDLPRGKHKVEVYAMFMAKRQFPKITALQQLSAVEDLCRNLVAVRQLGPRKKEILAAVNNEIKRQGLPIDPVNIAEVRSVSVKETGRIQVSFTRPQPNPENTLQPEINIVYFKKDQQSEPTVRVYGLQRE